jgi:tetratricopeptide (TPR) repeat protein
LLECSELNRQLGDMTGLAYAKMLLGHSTWVLGQHEAARELWAESLEQLTKAGDRWGMAMVYSFRGRGEREAGNFDQAEREYDRCVELFREVGDDWGLGIGLSHLGMVAFQKGDPVKARELFQQRLITAQKFGFIHSIGYASFLIAVAYWKLGDRIQMQRHLLDAVPSYYQIGNYATLTDCLVGLAWVEAENSRLDRAAYLLGAVEQANLISWIRMGFEDIYFHQPIVADLRSRFGTHYDDAIERGRKANLDELVKELVGNWQPG